MDIKNIVYKSDCKYFVGHIPCKPHKLYGVHCEECSYYESKRKNVLIIKLGAIGDVIRTTPLLNSIWREYPNALIWWLTYTPDIVPQSVDRVLPLTLESVLVLEETHFDLLINLDKDNYACALSKRLNADKKIGYTLVDGKPAPLDSNSVNKYFTGIFDDVNKQNTKSYLEEIFEICGWKFNKEEYILECDDSYIWNIPNEGKTIVGLNTGCGDRWVSRLWNLDYWKELILLLQKNNFYPVLLGGKQEDEKNSFLSEQTKCYYPGHFSLRQFISLVNQTDIVVTAVTMGLHIAIGLKKKVVLMNNIFNRNEFELYGRGVIIEPEKECKCFFSPKCHNSEYFCMESLKPITIFNAVNSLK